MTTFIKKYVANCDICQRMKNHPQKPFGPLQPNKVSFESWKIITADMITHLPKSDGYNAILVIVDRLTKRAHFYAITNEFSFKYLAIILMKRYYSLYELSLQIILDRDVQFAADLFQD